MADLFSKAKRSEIMSKVRGRGNKATEEALIRIFRRKHISGWRRRSKVFGSPDFVFWEHRLALFVDGCFWHGCREHGTEPTSNRSFWRRKLEKNKSRDRLVCHTLRKSGWLVLRVWQHELTRRNEENLIRRIMRSLKSARHDCETQDPEKGTGYLTR
jgi:DNA mismatch endonuclease (patch repair protein)